ncbi:hypothetical protein ACFQ05_11735 [Amycolatopsis umgeniensis]|uniref:Uncharacterized protein n=1 Tax=Amycolatopsis umgeniensis TaxID=336628 RepID=A0A841B531_9PSEU|nr:hypothetical protein [Amycolatopsis umgeniensis]MBB5853970.1 hypothetical protein [Amycolatopsis umgeniensis]
MQALFEVGPLLEAEAMRKYVADQVPGQVDIWEACAEVAAERVIVEPAPFKWPEPVGPLSLYVRDELFGGAVLS